MISKVLAKPFKHINFDKVPSSKCPCKFRLASRIKPWIQVSSTQHNWKSNDNSTHQERQECTISEYFDEKQRNPSYWRSVSHHELDWDKSGENHRFFWKFIINIQIKWKCNDGENFFYTVGETTDDNGVLNSVGEVEDEGDLCCLFSHLTFTYFP